MRQRLKPPALKSAWPRRVIPTVRTFRSPNGGAGRPGSKDLKPGSASQPAIESDGTIATRIAVHHADHVVRKIRAAGSICLNGFANHVLVADDELCGRHQAVQ